MEDYNYNFEKRNLLLHFVSAFDGVKIKRFDGNKFSKEVIKVPLVYSPKSHILNDVVGVADAIRLPVMAAEIKSENRDNKRVKNKIDKLVYKNNDGSYVALQAIPWNIEIEMTILTKFQEDMDQIIQNFSVNTNPYAIISWREPKSGREIRTEILWNGDVSLEYPATANYSPKEPPFRVTATTSFTIKGYLFKTYIENPKPICLINTDISFTDDFFCNYKTLTAYIDDSITESYSITGRPILRFVSPYYIKEGTSPIINITGYSFHDTIGVYVSGSNSEMYPLCSFTPFSAFDSFNGYPVNEFSKSLNFLSFSLPPPSSSGFIDIIAVNTCGYGILTEDSATYYPYASGLISLVNYPLTCTIVYGGLLLDDDITFLSLDGSEILGLDSVI
jgi:hypothetical protein